MCDRERTRACVHQPAGEGVLNDYLRNAIRQPQHHQTWVSACCITIDPGKEQCLAVWQQLWVDVIGRFARCGCGKRLGSATACWNPEDGLPVIG